MADGRTMAEGDEVPPGTAGSSDAVCPECQGTGALNGHPCRFCNATGVVTLDAGGGKPLDGYAPDAAPGPERG